MSKRKSNTTSGPAAKRAVKGRRLIQFEDVKSVEEQANEYLLGTVKFPLDALTKTWETGKNRRIDEKHVRELCKTFEEQHLQREDPKNHLLIECGGEEFGRMMDHVRQSAESMQGKWPSFHEWLSINSTHAEIMAGQHRVEALKLFLHRVSKINGPSAISDQAWWICRVYDRGTYRYKK